ncbi:hypothetical protein Dde_2828 [Oleidesulfovibrio alaskensis G20]|jgi:hypothetical protein|uniref:Lipoprotein n=1 Tax=Oleidesulfovibrio alaskensis (strain ATCC BAA-1058 / DSM 17464 / G20) TaxID=207559 RepID=Q30XH3_OLEA2|nr:hypothetical protein [Oleidesulfovibrio alaskensis]ABB39623.1 hypothetical protein Dde_2828 [Oleidesulfovibrio alaskensis G20]
MNHMRTVPLYLRAACIAVACVAFALLLHHGAAAAPPATGKTLPDKPAALPDRSVPVAVEHDGVDTAGTRLAFELKELFNGSGLFTLTDKDVPKYRVLISSVAEFPSRPEVGSVYSVIWVYSESEETLRHYLARDVGVVTQDTAKALALKLAERTDGIGVKYSYLFDR